MPDKVTPENARALPAIADDIATRARLYAVGLAAHDFDRLRLERAYIAGALQALDIARDLVKP